MNRFHGRLAVQQRVLPRYRVPFFDLLASACDGRMSLFSGLPRPEEGIATASRLQAAKIRRGRNIHLLRGAFYLCYQTGLIEWLEDWNPDALIVEANPRYLSTPSAVKWMHRRRRPVLGWGLGSPPAAGIRKRGRQSFNDQFDALITYSQRGAEEYAELGFPRDRIFIAYNSVSPPPDLPADRRPATVDRFTILFVGRLQARKRIDLLLHACSQLDSKPRLLVVGDGPERETLEALAREVYPSAEFTGARHGEELRPYFAQADLFVLPGTGGLAVQEAMSYGLPVIVAQGDGTQDDLVRPGNGWQIAPDDFDALLATMKDALSDAARLRRMGEESYRIVKEEINIERMVETFVRAVNSLTGK
jgi:glycosyltransferase involved in cell wall biosynthesis